MIPDIDFFGSEANFHHLGLVVKSITDVVADAQIITDPVQRVRLSFVKLNGVCIELLEPTGPDSPVFQSLQKKIKLVHICYSVPDITKAIADAEPHGCVCIARPVMAVAFNSQIAWLYHRDYGLIELLETA